MIIEKCYNGYYVRTLNGQWIFTNFEALTKFLKEAWDES